MITICNNHNSDLCGSSHYIREELPIKNVVKKSRTVLSSVERKKEQKPHDPAKKELSLKNEIEHEIECPRCHDIMTCLLYTSPSPRD